MARKLTSHQEIDDFINKVIQEAHHHGGNVKDIIPHLSSKVRSKIDLESDKIEVYERNGNLARTCWVTIGHRKWVFSYSYQERTIELRQGSIRGEVKFSFDNNTPFSELHEQVQDL